MKDEDDKTKKIATKKTATKKGTAKKAVTKKIASKKVRHKVLVLCNSCDIQCEGHGGGEPTTDGRCLCYDGTILECLGE